MRVRLKREKLLELITRSGISQNHWAIKLGLSRGHWSDIVNGKHPYPSTKTRQALLEALGVGFDDLFEYEMGPGPSDVAFQEEIAARYLIDREIGQGGMGTVYLARDVKLARVVAIKVVAAEAVGGVGTQRFLREVAHVSRLQHPHIVPLYDAGEATGTPYYVMPYFRDGSLRDLLTQRLRLGVAEALPLIRGIAQALQRAHVNQVLHCDVKPGNVLLDSGHAYVADFGIARALHSEVLEWGRSGVLDSSAGTPAYVSPEQASGESDLDGRSDLYSLGCLVYEMLAGRPPFEGRTTIETVAQRFAGKVPDLRAAAPEIPHGVPDVVARAMALDRADRQRSVADFLAEFERAALSRAPAVVVSARLGVARAAGKVRRQMEHAPGFVRVGRAVENLVRDLRYATRALLRRPAFTATAVLTLAVGIGANTSIFSAVRYLLLDPLPVESPEELALVYWTPPSNLRSNNIMSGGYLDPATGAGYRSNYSYEVSRALQSIARDRGVEAGIFNYVREVSVAVEGQPPVIVGGLMADGRYFGTLRPRMALGRPLTDADDTFGAPPAAVLSHAFWMRAFGGDPAVAGTVIRVGGHPFEVVGVTGRGFFGLSRGGFVPQTDITFPLTTQPLVAPGWSPDGASLRDADVNWLRILARVPRISSRATLERVLAGTIARFVPPDTTAAARSAEVRLVDGGHGERALGTEGRRLLWVLAGVVAMVLLIACVNLASLMLASGVARERELAVRQALGAGRWQVMRHLLLECLVLALAGAAGALVLTIATRGLLSALVAAGIGRIGGGLRMTMDLPIDLWLIGGAVGVAAVAAALFGILPAVRLTRDPASRGQFAHRGAGAGAPRNRLGRALIGLQIAISVPLVVGALLLLRTIANLNRVDLGFDPRGLVLFRLNPEHAGVPEDAYERIYLDVLREVEQVPGVGSATLVENPLMSGLTSNSTFTVNGREVSVFKNAVGPRFFETLGIPVLSGRVPDLRDTDGQPLVAAVNRAFVEQLLGGTEPIGQTVQNASGNREVRVVGVVGDSRYDSPRADVRPIMFDAALQRPGFGGNFVVLRTDRSPADIAPAIRRAVATVHRDLPVSDLRTQMTIFAEASARERVVSQLLGIFGAFALVLAAMGVHGITSYSVTRRTNEIGVRMAIGARPRQVLWLVLRQVVTVGGIGLIVGCGLAVAIGPVVQSLLYGVPPRDLVTVALAAAVMLAAVLGAGYAPARRAARVDPAVALRAE